MAPKCIFVLLFALLLPAAPGSASAFAAEAVSEQTVRAALVFNFIKFTEWPATMAGDPQLRICIATRDSAQIAAIEALGKRQVRDKTLTTVRFSRDADCEVIYVDTRQRWNEIAEMNAGGHILTIGGYSGFVADGGMIEIALQEGGVRFDINLLEAKRAGLRFYPQLLRLARRIVE
ncbi:MAG: YfiR family protein [Rhodocyclaceae bacterium]|nr:YfiR family protein [Rhodocyclaceae bacterium]